MTTRDATYRQKKIGLSTDTKPVGIEPGSTFYEIDTKLTYVTGDGINWVIEAIGNSAVPAANSTDNVLTRDIIGNKSDTAVYTPSNTASIIAMLKGIESSRILATGTFTTSSATVPADTARAEASNHWKSCVLLPLSGSCAFQPRSINSFANAGGVFTINPANPFTAAPGLVPYAILSEVVILPVYEQIAFYGGATNTGDLEGATKTITAKAEASGTGSVDYSASLTVTGSPDARLVVKNMAARLNVHIDSFSATTHLYCRVYVDAQDANHKLLDVDLTSAAADNFSVQDVNASTKATIFNLLKDGTAHTFYFFFWIDGGGTNAVISVVQLWEGIGTSSTNVTEGLYLNYTGMVDFTHEATKVGTGSVSSYLYFYISGGTWSANYNPVNLSNYGNNNVISPFGLAIVWKGSVATDINYLTNITINLRSY